MLGGREDTDMNILNLMPRQLHWQILIALVAAALAGMITPPDGFLVETYAFLGTLFLNALISPKAAK